MSESSLHALSSTVVRASNAAAVERWLRRTAASPVPPPLWHRDRLLRALERTPRFARFKSPLAGMLDVSPEVAANLLEAVDDDLEFQEELLAGLTSCWVSGGPAVNHCIRGFIRAPAGFEFPEHGHLGREDILVLQGAMILDDGRVARPGERLIATPGTVHSFRAQDGGVDLLYFAVVREGITVGDLEIRHRDTDD